MTLERRPVTKEEVVKDFRTAEIVNAARHVIGELGYADASMERIAHAAGVSKGTLYLYFRNKKALLGVVLEHGFAELMAATEHHTERVKGAEDKVREAVRAWLEHTNEQRAFLQGLQLIGAELAEQLRGFEAIYLRALSSLLTSGVEAGELRKLEADRVARLLMNLLRGTSLSRLNEPDPPDVEEDLAAVVDVLLHGIAAGEPR